MQRNSRRDFHKTEVYFRYLQIYVLPRLASGIGTGGTSVKHACQVGGLIGSVPWKNYLILMSDVRLQNPAYT